MQQGNRAYIQKHPHYAVMTGHIIAPDPRCSCQSSLKSLPERCSRCHAFFRSSAPIIALGHSSHSRLRLPSGQTTHHPSLAKTSCTPLTSATLPPQKAKPSSTPLLNQANTPEPTPQHQLPAWFAIVWITYDALSDRPRQSSPTIGFRMAVDR